MKITVEIELEDSEHVSYSARTEAALAFLLNESLSGGGNFLGDHKITKTFDFGDKTSITHVRVTKD